MTENRYGSPRELPPLDVVDMVEEAIRADAGNFTGYEAEWMRQRILHTILDSVRARLGSAPSTPEARDD